MEPIPGCPGAPWLLPSVGPGLRGGNKQLCPLKELYLM